MLRVHQSQAAANKVGAWLDSLLANPVPKTDMLQIAEGNTKIYRKEENKRPSLSVIRRRRSRRGTMTSASASFRTSWF